MVSLRVAIAAHGKELLMSFTGMVHIDLVTDQSDLFKPQVDRFSSVKVPTFGGARICGALGPICGSIRKSVDRQHLRSFTNDHCKNSYTSELQS